MNSNTGGRNLAMSILTAIALIGFMSQFANNLTVSLLFLVGGSSIMGLRAYFFMKDERDKHAPGQLDFSKLKQIKLERVSRWLKENVRGHNEIINDIVGQIQNNIQLARGGRCLGSFMLVGPTGTGKTFLAQLISDALFPGTPPLILRMNQYKSPDDVFTLLGSPPGRAGFELGGALTRPVLENRFRVIVLDELEKAHPDIFDCLYDILDTGTCREKSSGKIIDFSGCIFFATSNAAIGELRTVSEMTQTRATKESYYREALAGASNFDRAFIARWNRLFFMDTLSETHIAEVACLNISKYWGAFGLSVKFASPQLILHAVLRNREFKDYGVRQLMGYIRLKSDPVIHAALERKARQIYLDIDASGDFVVRIMEGAGHADVKKTS